MTRSSFALLRCLALLAGFASSAAAQWQVDPALTNLALEGEVYADQECNNPAGQTQPVPRPGPGDAGDCPPYLGPPTPLHPDAIVTRGQAFNLAFPAAFFDFGTGIDIQALDTFGLTCNTFVELAESNAAGFLFGDGLETRTLDVFWNTEVNNTGRDPDFVARGCMSLLGSLRASFHMRRTKRPFFLRIDLRSEGDADTFAECPQPICTTWTLPDPEDFELSLASVVVEVDNGGPMVLLNEVLDPLGGLPSVYPPTLVHASVAYPPGPRDIDVDVDVDALASATLMFPLPGGLDDGESAFDGQLTLHVITHDFLTPEPFRTYMRPVPKGGAGPGYDFRVGRHEITNQQYADFLNSAQADAGMSGLGSNLAFGAQGDVSLPDGTRVFEPRGVAADSRIAYAPTAPIGMRYTVELARGADPRSYEGHPATNMSWIGALKFCNWLTLTRGLAPAQRSYNEGPTAAEWHPATIAQADWAVRDLNQAERAALILNHRGFRLPMDELGAQTGWVPNQVRPFNEWYKAAAYDPQAPTSVRFGPGGEAVPPGHWVYGVGADLLTLASANFHQSGDPFDDDDGFVGLYDGSTYNAPGDLLVGNGVLFTTGANANPWGIHDLSGNVAEWGQDQVPGQGFALRGGSWTQLFPESAASWRGSGTLGQSEGWIGFRVVQSRPGNLCAVPKKQP